MWQANYVHKILKRILIPAFVAVYSIFSIGIIKATHFCMGEEASVVFFSTETEKCLCEKYVNDVHSCCSDEHEVIKIEDAQKNFTGYNINIPQLYILEDLYTEQLITSISTDYVNPEVSQDASPPKIPIFKKNCSFVFYDSEVNA